MLKTFWLRFKAEAGGEVLSIRTGMRKHETLSFGAGGIIGFSDRDAQHDMRLSFWSPSQRPPIGDQYDSAPVAHVSEESNGTLRFALADSVLRMDPWACAVFKFVMEVVNAKV